MAGTVAVILQPQGENVKAKNGIVQRAWVSHNIIAAEKNYNHNSFHKN